jgi:copper homeostasis protein
MLEVIVTSREDALAAAAGGADRLELVYALEQDGLTPDLGTAEAVLRATRVPVRAMLRARNTFDTAPAELEKLCETAAALCELGVDGLVLGFTRAGQIDTAALRRIFRAVPNTRVTFHRAIEHVNDPVAALNMLRTFPQIDTVLHSGGVGSLEQRVARLDALFQSAKGALTVLAGGGISESVIEMLLTRTRINAVHVGRAVREGNAVNGRILSDRVRALRDLLSVKTIGRD